MRYAGAVIGGLIGAAVGAGVWIGLAFALGWNHGAFAVLVGIIVGVLAGVVSRHGGMFTGLIASVFAIVGSLAGSLVSANALTDVRLKADEAEVAKIAEQLENTEYVISFIADAVVADREAAGQSVNWPPGSVPAEADSAEDYPPAVWSKALARWGRLTDAKREAFRFELEDSMRRELASQRESETTEQMAGMLGVWDLLFIVMGLAAAFGIAKGSDTVDRDLGIAAAARDIPADDESSIAADTNTEDDTPAIFALAKEQRERDRPEDHSPTTLACDGPAPAPAPVDRSTAPADDEVGPGAFFNLMNKDQDEEAA